MIKTLFNPRSTARPSPGYLQLLLVGAHDHVPDDLLVDTQVPVQVTARAGVHLVVILHVDAVGTLIDRVREPAPAPNVSLRGRAAARSDPIADAFVEGGDCLLYTSPSPRD